jgi:hypothetical protein
MLGVVCLALVRSESFFVLGVLSAGGLLGFVAVVLLLRCIHGDMAALAGVVSSSRRGGTGAAESFPSSLHG